MPELRELLQKAKKGDTEAFADSLAPLEKRLYHVALGLAGNHHDAEDIWQNTVFVAWRAIDKLRDPGAYKAWLTRILINEAHALFRQRKAAPKLMEDLPEEAHEPQAVEDYMHVHSCLNQLPPEQREAVVLRFWLDFPLQDIASITQVPLSTAKTRLYQGIQRLQQLMITGGEGR